MATQYMNKKPVASDYGYVYAEDASGGLVRVSQADFKATKDGKGNDIAGQFSQVNDDILELADKKITKFYASSLGDKTLVDSDNGKFPDINIFGKSVQNSYKGINLVDLSTPTLLDKVTNYTFDNKTGLVKFDYNGNYARAHFRDDTLAGKTLYLYLKNKTNTNASATVYGVDIMYKKAGESNFSYLTMNQPQYIIPSDATEITIRVLGNNSNTALSGTFSANIMFSSEPTDTFEPFVGGEASPNPSYPQTITSVADDKSLVVKSCGKNLFNVNELEVGYVNSATGLNQDTGAENGRRTPYLRVKPNTQYITNTTSAIRVFFYDEYKKFISTIAISKGFVTPLSCSYIRLHADITVAPFFTTELMLCEGTDATYAPYVSTESTLALADSLRGIPVTEGGNYTDAKGQQWICDSIEKYADGSGKLIQRVYHKVFDGTESFTIYSNSAGGNSMGYYNDSKIKIPNADNLNLKCNKLSTYLNLWANYVNGCMLAKNINTPFRIRIVGINTVADMQAQLKEWYDNGEPLEFICELAEYVETDLTAEELAELEKLQSFYHTTNIMVSSGKVEAGVVVNYAISLADGWNYIKQQLGDTRDFIYDMEIQSAEAYINSEYAVALIESEVM